MALATTKQRAVQTAELQEALKAIKKPADLAELSKEQLQAVANYVLLNQYGRALKREAELMDIDAEREIQAFLGEAKSDHTKRAYRHIIGNFAEWLRKTGFEKSIIDIEPKQAVDYLSCLKDDLHKSKATIRLHNACLMAFFNRLIDKHLLEIENPFDRAARRAGVSKMQSEKSTHFYAEGITRQSLERTEADLNALISHYQERKDMETMSVLVVIKHTGMRIGGFNEHYRIADGFIYTQSKGKEYKTPITQDLQDEIAERNGTLELSCVGKHLQLNINRQADRLYRNGTLSRLYSVHDFRHLFAIRYYRRTKDILGLCRLLNHTSIAITEKYLKGLGVEVL